MVFVCQIIVDKPNEDGVHHAGGIVSGVVKYAMDQPTEFEDITLSFKGESWCSWVTDDACTTYLGTENHVLQAMSLLNQKDDSVQILPAGSYEDKFLFTLPKTIPPSFSGQNGNVTYRITLEVRRIGKFNVLRRFVEAEVIVHNYLDPLIPDIPIAIRATKRLLKLSTGKQKMSLKAEIPKPYIKPGEKVELKLMITNESIVRIKGIRAELISTIIYTSNCGSKTIETHKIKDCTTETAKVPSRHTTSVNISVPILEEHRSVQYSKVISSEYKILVTVRLPMPYCNITTVVPILIGEKETAPVKLMRIQEC
ncbi:arrestin domain-containing protein 17 [Manduca sexta]|uniref:arrestin domain-containing protein 17 n=1 Tax=Manduca sexta TaxID=7130 RepID=UPI00188E15BB|nr:arrestin domain-containing protein 17 [Manduca sexta]